MPQNVKKDTAASSNASASQKHTAAAVTIASAYMGQMQSAAHRLGCAGAIQRERERERVTPERTLLFPRTSICMSTSVEDLAALQAEGACCSATQSEAGHQEYYKLGFSVLCALRVAYHPIVGALCASPR